MPRPARASGLRPPLLRVAAGGKFLALETDISRRNLARATAEPATQPSIIDAASGQSWSPSFGSDGTLAFLSNRSGTNMVWIMKPGTAPVPLFDGGLQHLGSVNFSPDGTHLVLVSYVPHGVRVRIMTAGGANISSFDMPSQGLGLPTWTPDGGNVILFDKYSRRAYRIDPRAPGHRAPVAPPHWVGIAMHGNDVFATRADKPGIWRLGPQMQQINDAYPAFYQPPLIFLGDSVLVPEFDAPGGPRMLAQPLAGGPARVIAYAPGAQNRDGIESTFAVNPRNGTILYDAMIAHDTNIDLLTLAKR